MGYEASGSGQIILKNEVPDEVLALLDERGAGFLVEDAPDGGLWFTYQYNSYNDQIEGGFKALAPYVKSGNVEFTGEDGEHWRFHFENGNVEEQNGEIVYRSKLLNEKKTFNVQFESPDSNYDETQYDIVISDFMTMFNELIGLFNQNCKEWYEDEPCKITGIDEACEEDDE